jgi:hypothetical protein
VNASTVGAMVVAVPNHRSSCQDNFGVRTSKRQPWLCDWTRSTAWPRGG